MDKKGTEKKTNGFTRAFVVLLTVFIAVLVLLSSRLCQRFTLTGESVILVVLLVILALSEVFDRFQLGNLLTLEQEKKAKEERLREGLSGEPAAARPADNNRFQLRGKP